MKGFSETLLEHVEPAVAKQLAEILPTVAEALGANPRAVIRFVNNVLIDLEISRTLAKEGLMEQIPAEYFAVSRCLQQRWPDAYNTLTTSEEMAKEAAGWKSDQMQKIAASEGDDYSGRVTMAKTLLGNRDLQGLLQSKTGKAWLTETATRNATVHFLRTQRREVESKSNETRTDYDIYLSYSKKDREKVAELVLHLANGGIRVFWDNMIRPGEMIRAAVERELRRCKAIGFCIGSDARESKTMINEFLDSLSLERHSILRIPILLPGSLKSDIPLRLQEFQYLDISAGFHDKNVASIIASIKRSIEASD